MITQGGVTATSWRGLAQAPKKKKNGFASRARGRGYGNGGMATTDLTRWVGMVGPAVRLAGFAGGSLHGVRRWACGMVEMLGEEIV